MSAAQRWRAPRQDGALLAEPPPEQVGPLLAANRRRLAAADVPLLGLPLSEARQRARAEAVAVAADYLRAAGEPLPALNSPSLLLAGHQPELFHPGVWVKNFALNGLARRHGATPLNLVVDNDTEKTAAVRLPTRGPDGAAHLAAVPFDVWAGEVPYEELQVRDEPLFATFADRAGELLRVWDYEPMLPEFWAEVRHQAARTPLVGERFVAARRAFERRWGCHNLEVPLSALCRTEAFARSACHLLSDLPRFHEQYNATVQEHRRRHGIRSRNHPVPDLAREGDWYEAPFWAWRTGQSRRGRLLVQPTGEGLRLRAGDDLGPTLRRGPEMMADWLALERGGFKVRTRALTTTLFARLLLADLFIHGIGGGKYDELTDELIRRSFGLEPPGFLVLSATLFLPLPSYPATPADRRQLGRLLRDLEYNPQRHLPEAARAEPRVRELVRGKSDLVACVSADHAGRRQRFLDLRALNGALRPFVQEQEEIARQRRYDVDRQLRENTVLQRRDFAFCLFPEAKLRPFFERFLRFGG